jgi:hypothetical protein
LVDADVVGVYDIPERNMPTLEKRIARINKRAVKVGCKPVKIEVLAVNEVEVQNEETAFTTYVKVMSVKLVGETPHYQGWFLAGTISALPVDDGKGGVLVEGICYAVPGVNPPRELATRFGQCDHCRKERPRNDVYALKNVNGEFKVVGSTCLGDFLGTTNPHALAAMLENLLEAAKACEDAENDEYAGGDGPRMGEMISTVNVLETAACIIRLDGFLSRARAEVENKTSTAHWVISRLYARTKTEEGRQLIERYQISEADRELAAAAREWARGLGDSANDYLFNLSMVARSVAVEFRTMGLAASLISAYQRELTRQAEANAPGADKHLGVVGERMTASLKFLGSSNTANAFGLTTICRYRGPEGEALTWFCSGTPDSRLTNGDTPVEMTFTVKSHGQFKDKAQTLITRAKLAPPKVEKKARAKKVAA